MQQALKYITERLPHVEEQAGRLFETDEIFRELCEEYQMCIETAARIWESKAANEGLQKEYVALRLRLEGEVLRYLAEHQP